MARDRGFQGRGWLAGLGGALVALALTMPTGAAAEAHVDGPTREISVTGTGEVSAAPDMSIITLGVAAEAPVASDALAETSRQMQAILAALEAAGVAPGDVQTSGLSLQPLYRDRGVEPVTEAGFQALNRVTVTLRDIAATGTILDLLVRESGANRIDGVRFGLSDPRPLEDAARRLAVEEARRKAELFAEAAGVTLGPVMGLVEQGGGGGPVPMAEARFSMQADVPVAQGELTISSSVAMRFAVE